jgi:hypothetical protein
MGKSLERYLWDNLDRGVIDHAVRALRDADGKVTFYIHPASVSGDTCGYDVTGAMALPADGVTTAVGACGYGSAPGVSGDAIHEAVLMIDAAGALVERMQATNNRDLLKSAESVAAQLLSAAKARLVGGK